jgi:hypothetical protein
MDIDFPVPTGIFGGLGFVRGEEEIIERLATNPRLVASGAFRLTPDVLAFPEGAADTVEQELGAMQIAPRRT